MSNPRNDVTDAMAGVGGAFVIAAVVVTFVIFASGGRKGESSQAVAEPPCDHLEQIEKKLDRLIQIQERLLPAEKDKP